MPQVTQLLRERAQFELLTVFNLPKQLKEFRMSLPRTYHFYFELKKSEAQSVGSEMAPGVRLVESEWNSVQQPST